MTHFDSMTAWGPCTTLTPEPSVTPYPKLPPPRPEQVREAVQRVFGTALGDLGPFFVGDFNGDGAEDVAVTAPPVGEQLVQLNGELVNWTIQETRAKPPASAGTPTPPVRVQVEPKDVLLGVLHGLGAQGWRTVDARQAYVLRYAGETHPTETTSRDLRALAPPDLRLPRINGDVLLAMGGAEPGFLYWTGAKYVWHPLPVAVKPSRAPG